MQPFKAICFGELLWDVLPSGTMPGGAPMNVAYHLHQLGLSAALISRVGNDELGKGLLKQLNDFCLPTAFLQNDDHYPTGIVHASIKENHEVEYDIVYPAAWDFISNDKNLPSLVEQSRYFIFGSLSARNETSRNTLFQLIEAARTKVFDINLRPPHYHKATLEYLLARAGILKLNEHEVKLVSGWFGDYATVQNQVKCIQDRFDIPTILVTFGERGALLRQGDLFYAHEGFRVNVADTVGSGDAFLAGFLFQLENKKPVEEALSFANALGAYTASQPGACPPYQIQRVFGIMKGK